MSAARARLGTVADVDAACRTLALAFEHDPVWGYWAFPDPTDRVERLTAYWRPHVEAAVRYDGLTLTDGAGAVAVWVPPGVPELDAEGEVAMQAMLDAVCGDRAPVFRAAYERFDAVHPHDEPHWYLSLLGTHPDHRGRGLAMSMVGDHLVRVDAERMPAYLESSNDVNLARYRRAGFVPRDRFEMPDGPALTTMWRPTADR